MAFQITYENRLDLEKQRDLLIVKNTFSRSFCLNIFVRYYILGNSLVPVAPIILV